MKIKTQSTNQTNKQKNVIRKDFIRKLTSASSHFVTGCKLAILALIALSCMLKVFSSVSTSRIRPGLSRCCKRTKDFNGKIWKERQREKWKKSCTFVVRFLF